MTRPLAVSIVIVGVLSPVDAQEAADDGVRARLAAIVRDLRSTDPVVHQRAATDLERVIREYEGDAVELLANLRKNALGEAATRLDEVVARLRRVEVLWVARAGVRPLLSTPVAVGPSVVVHASSTGLWCLDRRRGDVLWKAPGRFEHGPGILVGDTLFAAVPPDAVGVYDARLGDLLGRDHLAGVPTVPVRTRRRRVPPGIRESTPAELNGDDHYRIVAAGDGGSHAVLTQSGEIVSYDIKVPSRKREPVQLDSPVRLEGAALLRDDTLVARVGKDGVASFDLETGRTRWRKSLPGLVALRDVTASACYVNVRIADGRALVALGPADGTVLWRAELQSPDPTASPDIPSSNTHTEVEGQTLGSGVLGDSLSKEVPLCGPVIVGDFLLVWYGRPIAIAPKDGAVLWTLPDVRERFVTMSCQNGTVCCGTLTGETLGISASREGGALRWRCDWREVLKEFSGQDPGPLGGLSEARFREGAAYMSTASGTVFAARLPVHGRMR